MCYTKGPRCAKSAREELAKAYASGDTVAIKEAKFNWYLTKEGIKEIRAKGLNDVADKWETIRNEKIAESKVASEANKEARQQAKMLKNHTSPKDPKKRRKSAVVVVAGTGFLAATLLTGCSTNTQADYAKVCNDVKTQQRVSDDKCSNDGVNSGLYAPYFFMMSNGSNTTLPAHGQKVTGGMTSVPEGSKVRAGVAAGGESVSKSSFNKSSSGTSKSGFGGRGGGSGGG